MNEIKRRQKKERPSSHKNEANAYRVEERGEYVYLMDFNGLSFSPFCDDNANSLKGLK